MNPNESGKRREGESLDRFMDFLQHRIGRAMTVSEVALAAEGRHWREIVSHPDRPREGSVEWRALRDEFQKDKEVRRLRRLEKARERVSGAQPPDPDAAGVYTLDGIDLRDPGDVRKGIGILEPLKKLVEGPQKCVTLTVASELLGVSHVTIVHMRATQKLRAYSWRGRLRPLFVRLSDIQALRQLDEVRATTRNMKSGKLKRRLGSPDQMEKISELDPRSVEEYERLTPLPQRVVLMLVDCQVNGISTVWDLRQWVNLAVSKFEEVKRADRGAGSDLLERAGAQPVHQDDEVREEVRVADAGEVDEAAPAQVEEVLRPEEPQVESRGEEAPAEVPAEEEVKPRKLKGMK